MNAATFCRLMKPFVVDVHDAADADDTYDKNPFQAQAHK